MATSKAASESEPDLDEAFDRLVSEGKDRLARPWLVLAATGLLGGIDVGTGALAYLLVDKQTHNTLLAGLAFSIGFVALLLARSELFSENFLVPVVAVFAGAAAAPAVIRLWVTTLVMNLVGGWIITWLVIVGRPDLKASAREIGAHYAHLGVNAHSFALAVLAGAVITLMTRMQHATESLGVQLVPAILFGALVSGGELFHSVLDSLFMFAGLWSGASYGYLDWLSAMGWSALGNIVGGLALVTFIRLLQMRSQILEARAKNAN